MKPILAGAFAVACSVQAVAADSPVAVLSSPGGRYVFGQISSYHSDDYMLDTQTGRLWQITCFDQTPPTPGSICQDKRLQPVQYAPALTGSFEVYSPDTRPTPGSAPSPKK